MYLVTVVLMVQQMYRHLVELLLIHTYGQIVKQLLPTMLLLQVLILLQLLMPMDVLQLMQ